MVTSPNDYEQMLWEIQSNAPTHSAILLPKDEKILNIDLDSRTIEVPKFLSVEQDHQAEIIYFKFDRYFDYTDLTTKSCVIEYINAEGKSYVYPVPYYDVKTLYDEKKVLIPWCIQGPATNKAGTVKFAVRFYAVNDQKQLVYSLRTLVAESQILKGQPVEVNELSPENIDLDSGLLELIQDLQILKNEGTLALYWVDV